MQRRGISNKPISNNTSNPNNDTRASITECSGLLSESRESRSFPKHHWFHFDHDAASVREPFSSSAAKNILGYFSPRKETEELHPNRRMSSNGQLFRNRNFAQKFIPNWRVCTRNQFPTSTKDKSVEMASSCYYQEIGEVHNNAQTHQSLTNSDDRLNMDKSGVASSSTQGEAQPSLPAHIALIQRRRIANVRMIAGGMFALVAFIAVVAVAAEGQFESADLRTDIAGTAVVDEVSRRAQYTENDPTMLASLREEFDDWVKHHNRNYQNEKEHETRFQIWKDNHFRTLEKNKQHGPCKLTNKNVFGSNHFKDLTPQEFQATYLTGYNGPTTDKIPSKRKLRADEKLDFKTSGKHSDAYNHRLFHDIISSDGMHDPAEIPHHESVKERHLKLIKRIPSIQFDERELSGSTSTSGCYTKTYYNKNDRSKYNNKNRNWTRNDGSTKRYNCRKRYSMADDVNQVSNKRSSGNSCNVWDVSCWLQSFFRPIFRSGHSAESSYSQYSYPSSVDWREANAVTDIHSQGSCGACWAITAVETVESAYFNKKGVLRDLSESEIIACDDTCEMCNGGWPQNAYAYMMENKGVPPESSLSYDGDFLMTMTMMKEGESDEMTEEQYEAYLSSMCPAYGSSSSSTRYGAIKSYAYATDRCVCYTDGTGCDCDEQNESLAVANVASFGPATICLDASVFQDYTAGILTADSGCSSAFLDMNHCVQVVGYAYTSVESDDDDDDDNSKSGSGDQEDSTQREGYWIVRNQWSEYWGMDGYAYLAMGSNTCGILNDMTQVFFD